MRSKRSPGFSLVEVCIALGIAAFCLVAIFSLLPIGLRGNLESSEETVATGILSQVAADLAACPATAPRGKAATTKLYQIAIPANPVATEISAPTRYFNDSGYDGLAAKPGSHYRVDMAFLTNSGTSAATMVHLKASWPAAAAKPLGKVETFVALDRN
jgi:Tfp pilus assembly protein PilV